MKTFCSAQEIEDLAAQGRKELVIDQNTVLTDMARHVAQQLGIKIVYKSQPAGAASASAPVASSLSRPAPFRPGSKPKGCQHAPLTNPPASAAPPSSQNSAAGGSSGTVVDQLVGLVKRLGNNKGGGS
ncbi:MAG: hypothetical protein Fur0044_51600 [Anaerolineae bacterium]|nr:hypothetical protein [Anaerolineales bacterium]MCQ3977530.1 hypothetical protein [Anaerolineae bacterium]